MASFTVSRHFAEEGDEENTRRRFAELTELGWPEHYGARFFGEREAAVYDDLAADMFDPAVATPVVDKLDVCNRGATRELAELAEPLTSVSRSHVSIDDKSWAVRGLVGSPPRVSK